MADMTPEEMAEKVSQLESDLAHVSRDLERLRSPLIVRYRLNVKDSTAGIRTTDGTLEITGSEDVLDAAIAGELQDAWQSVIDQMYPPPTPKGTASSAT